MSDVKTDELMDRVNAHQVVIDEAAKPLIPDSKFELSVWDKTLADFKTRYSAISTTDKEQYEPRRLAVQEIWIVGPRENIFCWLEDVRQFDGWQQCLEFIKNSS